MKRQFQFHARKSNTWLRPCIAMRLIPYIAIHPVLPYPKWELGAEERSSPTSTRLSDCSDTHIQCATTYSEHELHSSVINKFTTNGELLSSAPPNGKPRKTNLLEVSMQYQYIQSLSPREDFSQDCTALGEFCRFGTRGTALLNQEKPKQRIRAPLCCTLCLVSGG